MQTRTGTSYKVRNSERTNFNLLQAQSTSRIPNQEQKNVTCDFLFIRTLVKRNRALAAGTANKGYYGKIVQFRAKGNLLHVIYFLNS